MRIDLIRLAEGDGILAHGHIEPEAFATAVEAKYGFRPKLEEIRHRWVRWLPAPPNDDEFAIYRRVVDLLVLRVYPAHQGRQGAFAATCYDCP